MTEKMFFEEISETELEKFREYLEKGKQMDKKRILCSLIDIYVEYCGVSICNSTMIYDFISVVLRQYFENEEIDFSDYEHFCSAIHQKTHLEYLKYEDGDEFDFDFNITIFDKKDYPFYCREIVEEYAHYYSEKCAAICYGLHCWQENQEGIIFYGI